MDESAINVRLAAIEGSLRNLLELVESLADEKLRKLPALMTQRQVAEYLRTSRVTILRLVKDGLLTPIRQEGAAKNAPVRYKVAEVLKLKGITLKN